MGFLNILMSLSLNLRSSSYYIFSFALKNINKIKKKTNRSKLILIFGVTKPNTVGHDIPARIFSSRISREHRKIAKFICTQTEQ